MDRNTFNMWGFDLNNLSTEVTEVYSALIKDLYDILPIATYDYSALRNPTIGLSIGVGPMDIKVYFTVNGMPPTINTGVVPGSCERWEAIPDTVYHPPTSTVENPIKRISWIAVYPEFVINSPASISYSTTSGWGNAVNI